MPILPDMYPCKPDIFEATYSPAALAAGQATAAQAAPATQQAGESVYAFRRKGLDDFCTCDAARYEELSNKPHLFETRVFYTAPQPSPTTQAASVQEDAARHFFDAGWKACANFCDRDDVRFDGIVGHRGCPQFDEAFRAARKQGEKQ